MEKKSTTVSVRLDDDRVQKIKTMKDSHDLSQTSVIQNAVDILYNTKGWSPEGHVKVPISKDTMKRARTLHYTFGCKLNFEQLISEAVDRGINVLYEEYINNGNLDEEAYKRFRKNEAIRLDLESFEK